LAKQKISDFESNDAQYRKDVATEHQRLKKECSELASNFEITQGTERHLSAENGRLKEECDHLRVTIKELNSELTDSSKQLETLKRQSLDLG
jgi:predicted nuclease with TOPRIM domain